MKISTNWLKDFVPLTPPLEALAERLTMAGLEVKRVEKQAELKDTIFEVEITTNRPDWLSHLGVAREIHAVDNKGLKLPPWKNPEHRPMPSGWSLALKEAEGCPYYTACLMEGVEQGETPDWMCHRLEACGIRSINLIVDITNYVLLEIGQPLHAFDADLLRGKEVQIRRAKPEEPFRAINGTPYTLTPNDLVIADKVRAVALAGVMGGEESEVSDRTRNLLLESAFFTPRWVRKTSLLHGLASESSYRFERRVDPEGVDLGRERAIYLFRELAKPRYVSTVIQAGRRPALPKNRLHLSLDQVRKILGMEVRPHQIHSVLTRLDLEPKKEGPETWHVRIPSYRADLERPVDLVEEVARLVGYDGIPETLPAREPVEIPPLPLRDLEERSRDFFVGMGLFEAVTFSLGSPQSFESLGFDPKEIVQIHNPIHKECTALRPTLLLGLLEALGQNERIGERGIRLFEIAHRFLWFPKEKSPAEETVLGLLLAGEREAGWGDAKRDFHFFDLKGILEAYLEGLGIREVLFQPEESPFYEYGVSIQIAHEPVGRLGEVARVHCENRDLTTRPVYAELSLERLASRLPQERRFEEIPRYPAVERDLSLLVDESVTAGEIAKEIQKLGREWVRDVKLFDLFRGGRIPKGRKNMAFRITYQSLERTLFSEEVQHVHERMASEIAKKYQGEFQKK